MAQAKCKHPILKAAFLFGCLTGLRWSDVNKLTWSEVREEEGQTRLIFQQKKTAGYIYQLAKIYQVEIYDPILQTQKKLAQLKISTLWSARIMFLQLPVWTTFWWNESMLTDWSIFQWAITIFITISFTFMALWLFFNINYKNRNKKWFKFILRGKEWTPLIKSMELIEQVDDYKINTNSGI